MGTKTGCNEDIDNIDTITMDVPLLLRLLEWAKEDAKTDMDLHHIAENLISLSQKTTLLTMQQYNEIINTKE